MRFSIQESLRFGWEATRTHSRVLFAVLLTVFALQVAHGIVVRVLEDELLGVFAIMVLTVVEVLVGVGLTLITLRIARGEKVAYAHLLPPWGLAWRYVAAGVLAGLAVLVGLILLIVPGIYLMLRFSMVRFAVLDGAGIMESLRKSGELTRGVKWKLLGFVLVMILLNVVGAMVFFVGLLISVPVTMIAYAHVYQKLLAHHHGHAHHAA